MAMAVDPVAKRLVMAAAVSCLFIVVEVTGGFLSGVPLAPCLPSCPIPLMGGG